MWDDLWTFLQTARDLSEKGMFHMAFQDLVASERTDSMRQLRESVEGITLEQFDAFEGVFLEHSLLFVDPDMRIRAMQLYAWIKLLEYEKAGHEFRGFPGDGSTIE